VTDLLVTLHHANQLNVL
jgi:hypothetical protein